MFKKTAAVIFCLTLVVAVLALPAQAAVTGKVYDPADYMTNVVVDGMTETVTFVFDDILPATRIEPYDGSASLTYYGNFDWYPNIGETGAYFKTYYRGSNSEPVYGEAVTHSVIDVSDLVNNAVLSLQAEFSVTYRAEPFFKLTEDNPLLLTVRWGAYCYGESGASQYLVQGAWQRFSSTSVSSEFVFTPTDNIDLPSNTVYIIPFVDVFIEFPATTSGASHVTMTSDSFSFTCDINMFKAQSETMEAIKDELEDINDKLDDTNDKLDDTNDKLDDLLDQPEQEKQEASSSGDGNIDAITGAVPDYSAGFMEALQGLAAAMSYDGTEAKLTIPAIDVPGLGGLFAGFRMMDATSVDFGVYIQMLPASLLLLVQSLLTIALIVYCFKELYSVISYFLTLKGGSA